EPLPGPLHGRYTPSAAWRILPAAGKFRRKFIMLFGALRRRFLWGPAALTIIALFSAAGASTALAQEGGAVRGVVTFEATGGPVSGATVLIVNLGRTTIAGPDGAFEFRNVPFGSHTIVAQREFFTTARQII